MTTRRIVVSWVALNNDFMYERRGAITNDLEQVNEDGPNFNLHKHFWVDGRYSAHILLNNSSKAEHHSKIEMLVNEIIQKFKGRTVLPKHLLIDDPINVSEIFCKVQPLLVEYINDEVEVFISPGTPAMQTAWYLLATHFKKNTTLFQIREAKFTKDKLKPAKIIVELDSSIFPHNLVVAQKEQEKQIVSNNFNITSSIATIYEKASMIAKTDNVGCLILGENGTGKENLAHYIHEKSNRSHKPFIAVNCAAFSDELLRSELFGHERGSFTGADKKKIGVFEAANGGTVFLDEIGDISPKMQVSILRALQSRRIQPVGSTKEIELDLRIISATNKDVEAMSERGEFRTDLFYRLAVTELRLPPLRERGRDELQQMVMFFNDKFAKTFNRKNKLKISTQAMDALLAYGYKGNIRELENMFISFYTFCEKEVSVEDLPIRVQSNLGVSMSLAAVEKEHVIKVFRFNKGNILATAKSLDIHRATLKAKLIEYGLRE